MKFLAMAVGLIFLAGCSGPSSQTTPKAAGADAEMVVATVYEGFSTGDFALATSTMASDIVWNEAEGNPYADKNPYEGPDAILTGLFARLGGDWDGFTASAGEFVIDGDRVVVFGRYTGTYKTTGKAIDAPFVHAWTVRDGKIVAFQQYTDTAEHVAVMAQ